MHKLAAVLLMSCAVALSGCGGGDTDDTLTGAPPATGTGGTGGPTATASVITVTSSVPSILSDGSTTATITAYVRDANNALISGVPVVFTATSGGVSPGTINSDSGGAALTTLSTAGVSTLRTITVTATTGSLSATVNVQVVAGSSSTTVQMGSGTGANFQVGTLAVSNANVSAGGSTSLQVVLQQSDGTLYTQPASITFSSSCGAQNLASIQSPVSTSTGIASTTYAASGCSGDDVITATTTLNGNSLSASGTVTVAAAAIGSIQFESATPTNIALKGTGGAGRQETSTVVFRVLDSSGGPRANAQVTFTLDSQVGGINLTASSAQSDANGRVQTVVNAGTVATSVRVTARIATPAISTQSSQLTITTGIPDTDSFSLAPTCSNVESFNIDGVTMAVTARLADRYNNPVPDGTAVAFQAEGGSIIGQCQTTTTATEGGVCSVNWRSSDPRPLTPVGGVGRVSILATAIGEDSFVDSNSNGYYDSGETFADLGEPFRDDNEDAAYNNGEPFFDFNSDGVRNANDSAFSGVTCTGTGAGSTCDLTTTSIGARTIIVMSTSGAVITGPAAQSVARNATVSLSYTVKDLNGNAMPRATTIAGSATATAGTLGTPSSVIVPCDASRAGTPISLLLTAPGTAGSGFVTITVTSPGGIITTFQTTITVT